MDGGEVVNGSGSGGGGGGGRVLGNHTVIEIPQMKHEHFIYFFSIISHFGFFFHFLFKLPCSWDSVLSETVPFFLSSSTFARIPALFCPFHSWNGASSSICQHVLKINSSFCALFPLLLLLLLLVFKWGSCFYFTKQSRVLVCLWEFVKKNLTHDPENDAMSLRFFCDFVQGTVFGHFHFHDEKQGRSHRGQLVFQAHVESYRNFSFVFWPDVTRFHLVC